ncbi:CIC11C00000004561 [Sungouiella intermedia]|uniref:PAN2-PAN3 deadenylation complex subunit PAN3 n=1 Tax=Sungouiella intermedia TaxID=45354 RepID=A0A1L0G0Q8_9ASCO|nr:CIC11C00000004561 [[Candida] intermedia]
MNINPDAARDIPCKNVLIYGYCKFENKGCAFSHGGLLSQAGQHQNASKNSSLKSASGNSVTNATLTSSSSVEPVDSTAASSQKPSLNNEPKRKFNMNTPLFQPSVLAITNKFATLSPKLKEIPIFVPSSGDAAGAAPSSLSTKDSTTVFASRKFNASTPSFTPSNPFDAPDQYASPANDGYVSQDMNNSTSVQSLQQPGPAKQQNPYLQSSGVLPTPGVGLMPPVSDYRFLHTLGPLAYPLNYHLYAPAPPPRFSMQLKPHETTANAMFIPNDLRELLTKKNEATLQTMSQLSLPEHVGVYHSLVPIDLSFDNVSKQYQIPSHVYKVTSNVDGAPYAMRRIDYSSKLRILNELPFSTVKKWKALKNPNIVQLHDAFTSVGFINHGEPTLCLVYDFYPTANTLQEHHLTRRLGGKLEPITEDILWAYVVQLTNALLAIHKAGLNAGSSISLSKILVTNKNRVRLGAVCVDDILEYEAIEARKEEVGTDSALHTLQLGDIIRLGRVINELACATLPVSLRGGSFESTLSSLRSLSSVLLSEEFLTVLKVLNTVEDEFDLLQFYNHYLSQRTLNLLNGLQDLTDFYESQLLSEVENGRLFRLMVKINYVVDRRPQDSELSGSLLVIKLFRDFIFQTCNEFGKPVADLSKVLTNLNKLDVGVDEKILLISREEDSCIIVSYKEVKDIIDLTFRAIFR